mmetsp:Transcript_6781/g.23845  ORF Transcript_6781/g.23845 Transcript_6781/m.23845 type:complete len:100 (-) Transcript_6781:159-458(-)
MGGVRIASEAAGAQERRPETADRRSQPRTWQCGGVCVDAQVEEDEEEDEEEQEEEEGGIDMRGSNLNPAFLDSTEMRQVRGGKLVSVSHLPRRSCRTQE